MQKVAAQKENRRVFLQMIPKRNNGNSNSESSIGTIKNIARQESILEPSGDTARQWPKIIREFTRKLNSNTKPNSKKNVVFFGNLLICT